MFAQYLTIILVNTYSWVGGQGYCAYDFAIHESEHEYSSLAIVMRPQFDPANTASGNTELDDQTITLESLGGARFNWANTAKIETDCNITGFTIVKATAIENDQPVDLLSNGSITIETYKALPVTVGGQ
ncbi:hypothetical protein IHQ71_02675 [Rhizobium sp. TH2]|uniref:hypothetical protein n=1 Tax=Rhizobium sp. TH2 TaxID=2775403 RepID=UPI002157A661|nr:hypothetical protein [Rhizobium sp. TH2]UVC09550.1 hypothetical protein IHQ71_02675 [Rhizobium sp. TH2]